MPTKTMLTKTRRRPKPKADPWAGYHNRDALMEALRKHLELDHVITLEYEAGPLVTASNIRTRQAVWAEWITIHDSLPHMYTPGESIDAYMAANGPGHPYARLGPKKGR